MIGITSLLLLTLGFLIAFVGIRVLKKKKPILGSFISTTGFIATLFAMVLFLVFLNVRTYQRLTSELPVAKITLQKLGGQKYQLKFDNLSTGQQTYYELLGDEWQLDTKFLKWKSWVSILGKEPLFRLDRLSGRYQSLKDATNAQKTAYSLSKDPGINLWETIKTYEEYMPWVDAYFGSSVYMPMNDGLSYQVNATQSGLIARPLDKQSTDAVRVWK